MLSAYAKFIVRYSYLTLFVVSAISTALTVIPFVCHELPSFTDPIVGFETRGTTLAHRFIAWENLIDETRPSQRLAVNPQEIEDQKRMNATYNNKSRQDTPRSGHKIPKGKGHKKKKKVNYNTSAIQEVLFDDVKINESSKHVHWGYGKNVSYEDENIVYNKNHTRKQWISLKMMQREFNRPFHFNDASNRCGSPVSDYAHLVITTNDNTSLLLYENVERMCNLQSVLVELGGGIYHKLCQRSTHAEDMCCPVWSMPNYIALMSGKHSCDNLTREDVNQATSILRKCAEYFHNFTLKTSCDLGQCNVPKYCSQDDAVYNLLFYLIDSKAFSPPNYSETFVRNSMIFFPLPSSSTVLPYYMKLYKSDISLENLVIPAIDFGLKNALFDLWVIDDTWLVGLGGLFVFLCVWVYTKSFILTIMLFIAIAYSTGIAYFLYVYVFNLEFFPFMNLLVIVVIIGIGADDAFLYVKIWKTVSKQLIKDNAIINDNGLNDIKNMSSAGETILVQILEETLRHSVLTILVTTITTAVAFLASYLSYIPAINCFSVFAGTAVLVNFFLMVTWLPVSVYIVDVKLSKFKRNKFDIVYNTINEFCESIRVILNRFLIAAITKLHFVFIILMGAIGVYSLVVVFYAPGLQLPDSRQFQLFQSSHPFEKYDMEYKDQFIFDKFGKYSGFGSKMPLRWIWGIEAIDNGNHMNPTSMGKLIFDRNFSISHPDSQQWLLQFCTRVKGQPFYQHTLGPLLPNCFIETFKMYMNRRCMDKIAKENRSPCCESSHFPYTTEVFELCIIKLVESLYQTPREFFMPGVAGPKFLRSATPPKVAAIVIEFESVIPYSMSYDAINNFFLQVENWTQEELKSAPEGMRNGWFLSDLQFYDLQGTLARGTVTALILSASLGFIVLIPATLNLIVSISALIAMVFSSTVTIAILVLNNWKLNVLESVAISTSAGLAVDFSLHYALSYTQAGGTKSSRIKFALSTSAGPTATAALTTGIAGIFLLRSNLLPYSQIGSFLALIMLVSWMYGTFFLCSLLYIFGSNSSKNPSIEERKSVSRVSSICSGVPNLESHELEHLADSNPTNVTHSLSPSNVSATTMILHDDFENTLTKIDKNRIITSNTHYNDND